VHAALRVQFFALQQGISVLEHCHAIDTSQVIATGQFRFLGVIMHVMPFTAQAYMPCSCKHLERDISRQFTPVPSDLYGFSTTSIAK